MSRLALGTAQFGLTYGIANQKGQIKFSEANKILELAKNSNIDLIDTAIVYGNSEKVLGRVNVSNFKVITKTRYFDNLEINNSDIKREHRCVN